ncbi:hypothetical protein KCU81_g568, partial [Aureobasidium melanogenum]
MPLTMFKAAPQPALKSPLPQLTVADAAVDVVDMTDCDKTRFRLVPATYLDPLSTNHSGAGPFLGPRRWCVHGFISTAPVDQHQSDQTGTAQPIPDSVNLYWAPVPM